MATLNFSKNKKALIKVLKKSSRLQIHSVNLFGKEGQELYCVLAIIHSHKAVGNGRSKHSLATQPGLGRISLRLSHSATDYIRPRRKWLYLQNKGLNALRKRI
jgi:hypothetical protein